ncbi:MAG: DUF120 domain-containing protein, partial [Methanobrevibacter sp.]|nr:DUF120 domain-containing protein [Methanobrevibacter sp.]
MELNGKVTTGYGKGCYFLSQDYYKDSLTESCGFTPFPGTLNIIFDEKYTKDIRQLKENALNKIKGDEDHGGLRFINAILEDTVHGAIVFPDKTTHEENYLEFIAEGNLREKFDLE